MGITKVKQQLKSCVLGTDLILGYGIMENVIGGGMGGPLGPNPNSSETCEKNIFKIYLIFYGYKLCAKRTVPT